MWLLLWEHLGCREIHILHTKMQGIKQWRYKERTCGCACVLCVQSLSQITLSSTKWFLHTQQRRQQHPLSLPQTDMWSVFLGAHVRRWHRATPYGVLCVAGQENWAVKGRILSIGLINVSVIHEVFFMGLRWFPTRHIWKWTNRQTVTLLYM